MAGFIFPFGPIPDDVRQQMEEQQDRQYAEIQAWHHEQDAFFAELTQDQILTLNRIMRNLGGDLSGRTAAFYEGICQSILTYKFQVCPGCGVNHTEEFAREVLGEHEEHVHPLPEKAQKLRDGVSQDQLTFDDAIAEDQPKLIADEVDEAEQLYRRQTMERYNVAEDPENPPFLKCLGCGLTYVSLEDRMVKAPDDCHGCAHKSKWG